MASCCCAAHRCRTNSYASVSPFCNARFVNVSRLHGNNRQRCGVQSLSAPIEYEAPALQIVGGEPLRGHVEISGSKNGALALMAACLLTRDPVLLKNVPKLSDIRHMLEVLSSMGVGFSLNGRSLHLDASSVHCSKPEEGSMQKLRASFLIVGPLVSRFGEAVVSMPGGCNIGSRPVDLHLRGLQAMGAAVRQDAHSVSVRSTGRLKGATIFLDYPSVGATETLIMAASLAEGETVLYNAAREPEVVALASALSAMGADIVGAGCSTVSVRGVAKLHGIEARIPPDRIEAATFMAAAAITRGSATLAPVVPSQVLAVTCKLQKMGCRVEMLGPQRLAIHAPGLLHATDITTTPFPGFPTDMQPQFTALLSTCSGCSRVTETVFEGRMAHVNYLQLMGASISIEGSQAIIHGCTSMKTCESQLCGADVVATDLRAGAALVLAALAAQGQTRLTGLSHIERGYEAFTSKLLGLGAQLQTSSSEALNSLKL